MWPHLQLVVTGNALFEAIRQVELLAEWMEERLFNVLYPGNRAGKL
ncbi:hypothetical protein X753_20180 [Mesorhizobium sp. LNJC399B00]|nr:hypothetical protein X753_20180 [Mesorhizobium sp. LNJC399B00]